MAVYREDEFFVVWSPSGGNPSARHNTEDSAKREAKRLASVNVGTEFIVLKAVYGVTVGVFQETNYDDIPF